MNPDTPPATSAGLDAGHRPVSPRSWGAVALVWSFAEATFFFIVADVFLSWIALRNRRAAWRSCLWAAAGSVLGGAVMFTLGRLDPTGARAFIEGVPAISPALVDQSASLLARQGSGALFSGMVTGRPYKVFAVLAGTSGLSLPGFLAASFAARLLRFGLVAALAGWLAHGPLHAWSQRRKVLLHLTVWTAIYAIYFGWFGF